MNPCGPQPGGPTRRDFARISIGSALAGSLAHAGEADAEAEAEPLAPAGSAGEAVAAIDVHIHVVPNNLPGLKSKPDDVEDLYQGKPPAMAERLQREMKQANLEYAFGMGALDGPAGDPLGIAGTIAMGKLVPGLRAIGVADPRKIDADHLKAVEAQIEANRDQIVAFKAYLGYLHFGPDHPNYVPYYRLAEKYNLVIILHTGDNWSTKAKVKYAHPLLVDEVAVDHPGVNFVMAHFGNPWLVDGAEVLFKNENVWADLSGLFVGTGEQIDKILADGKLPDSANGVIISDLKKAMGYVDDFKKFVYGSDWPLAPMAAYRRLIEAIVPPEAHSMVFRDNAAGLFRLAKS
ncbi:MAG: amidohydrolase family protein [Isosphaeraceae bacterium]